MSIDMKTKIVQHVPMIPPPPLDRVKETPNFTKGEHTHQLAFPSHIWSPKSGTGGVRPLGLT